MYLTCCPRQRSHPRTVAPTTVPLCTTCSALNITEILLSDGHSNKIDKNIIPLGPLVEILHKADQCRFCHLVALAFRNRWCLDRLLHVDLSGVNCGLYGISVGTLADPHLEEKKRCHRLRIDFSNRPTPITDVVTLARMDLTLEVQLLQEDAHKFGRSKEVHGRRVADTVNMKLVKTWITLCEREHGDACASVFWWRATELHLPPFVRVLDVNLMTLVQAPPDCRYMALSYVWGMAGDSYWTTKANFDSRTKPSGLDPSVLPATIQDSIHVTRALGERYLWIDALCIIQDSSDDKSDQISAMELIYSGASLTIVAAGGESAHAPLPGFSAGSRNRRQHIEIIEDLHLAIPLPSLREAITQTVWDTRGWTYQELLLSRRRLFFTKDQVYFECAKDVWCEDLVAESKTLLYSDHPMRVSGSGSFWFSLPKPPRYPDLEFIPVYRRMVEQYTRRHLTYSSDVIHAIAALTNATTRGYQLEKRNKTQAFRYGMQIWNLNYSLLWHPRLDSSHTRRVDPNTGISACPSWAWAGWIGATYHSSLEQLMTTAILTTFQEKPEESLVRDWYIIGDDHRLIHLEVEKISFIWMEAPLERDARPRYQVPKGDIDKQQLEPFPPPGTLIFCTQCACFRVSKLEETSSGSNTLPHTIFRILSDARQPSVHVGRIILPSSTASHTVLEFIVLSRCSSADMPGLYDDNVYGDRYDACLLFVMAVRKVGPEARVRERVGLGVIFEQAWLECGAKVDMVLLG